MSILHERIAATPVSAAVLLGLVLTFAGGCSEVLEDRSSDGATAAGSGPGGAGAGTGGAGGAAGGGGSGGAAPADMPWQLTSPFQGWGSTVAVDAEGNVVLAGVFGGALDLGGSTLTSAPMGTSLFVTKLDSAGQLVWAKSFPCTVNSLAMTVDGAGDVLLAGAFQGTLDLGGGTLTSAGLDDVFVAKLDPSGEPLYSVSFGDAEPQSGAGIAVDTAGNAYVTGTFMGTLAIGGDTLTAISTASFVAELDPSGTPVWARAFGDGNDVEAQHIAWSPDGEIAVTGSYSGTPDLGGGPLPATAPDSAFLLRIDPAGNHLASDGFNCRSIAPAFDGSARLTVGCAFTGYVDFGSGPMLSGPFIHLAVAMFGGPQSFLGVKVFGQTGTTVYDVALSPAPNGALLVAGRASGSLDLGGGDLLGGSSMGGFLGETDVSFDHLWSQGLGGSGDVQQIAVAVGPTGDVFATGSFEGTIDLATGPTTAPAATGLFLMKLVP